MDSLFKNLNNVTAAFDIEKVAGVLEQLDEFPDRSKQQRSAQDVFLTGAAISRARQAQEAWEQVDLEGRKPEWESLCTRVKGLRSSETTASAWEERAKDSEYKLVQICSLLIGAPDPIPFFESAATLSSKVLEIEAQNKQLMAKAADASADNEEVQQLIEQHRALQTSHKEAQDEIVRMKQDAASAASSAAAGSKALSDLAVAEAEKARLQASLKSLKEEHERGQTALFEVLAAREEEGGSQQREVDIVLEELERSQRRVGELEKALEMAAAAQNQMKGGHKGQADATSDERVVGSDPFWEHHLRVSSDQVESLKQQLEAATVAARDREAQEQVVLQQAANRTAALELQLDQVNKELLRRPQAKRFEEVQERVEALELLVDVQMEAEGWDKVAIHGALQKVTLQSAQSVMQERNRRLAGEVTSLKCELSDKASQLLAAEQAVARSLSEQHKLQQLVKQLEDDLLQTSSHPGATTRVGVERGGSFGGAAGGPDLTSLQGPLDPAPESSLPSGDPEGSAAEGRGGLLDIVVSQRNRFRQRAIQLEVEKGQLSEELGKVKRQLDECRADNVSLYEKVRYLEQYSQKQVATGGKVSVLKVDEAGVRQAEAAGQRGNRYQCGPLALEFGGGSGSQQLAGSVRSRGSTSRKGGGRLAVCFPDENGVDEESGISGSSNSFSGGSGPEARYIKAYEARVNPFAEFQKTEVDQRVKSLQLHDRAVLAGSKLLVGSRFARAFTAVYAVLLHLFIMVLLYYAMSTRTQIEMVDIATLSQQATSVAGDVHLPLSAGGGGNAAATTGGAFHPSNNSTLLHTARALLQGLMGHIDPKP